MSLTAEQAIARRQFIGGSDLPAVWDYVYRPDKRIDLYRDAVDVYWSKVGDPLKEIKQETPALRKGNCIEDYLLDYLESEKGLTFERNQQVSLAPDMPLGASFDGINRAEKFIAEAKRVQDPRKLAAYGSARGENVPQAVYLQMQFSMYVAGEGFNKAYHVAMRMPDKKAIAQMVADGSLFGDAGLYEGIYVIRRDDEVIRMAVKAATKFWQEHIVTKIEPERIHSKEAA